MIFCFVFLTVSLGSFTHNYDIFRRCMSQKLSFFYFYFVLVVQFLRKTSSLFLIIIACPPRFQANKGNPGPVFYLINYRKCNPVGFICLSIYLSIYLSLGNAAVLLAHVVIKLFTKREGRIVKEEIGSLERKGLK